MLHQLNLGKLVRVYKIKGLVGKRYSNSKKVPKSAKCWKTKKAAEKTNKSKKSGKDHTGWCIKKRRAVKVYKFSGLAGRRYGDKKKVPKGTRCYKTQQAAKNAIGTRKRKYNN